MGRFLLVRVVTLALLAALAAALGAGPSQAADTPAILRVYFRSAAERDRLVATLNVLDHGIQPEGYLLAYGDQATLRRLRATGYRTEIDEPRTHAEFSSAAAFFKQGYLTVEELYADLDA